MKQMSEQELSHRLSQYVDGELSPSEALEVDAYLAAHPETTKELRELQAMKRILRAKEKLPANIGFWTRLSVALEHLKEEEQNFLPFPRRFIPAATALGLVSMVAVAVILFQQREALLAYLSKKTVEVQQAYEGSREGSFLKGVITPLLANIGRDEVLQFALFGTLSLDEQSETALRVDESSEKGYRIEFGKPRKGGSEGKKSSSLTVKEFYDEIKPTQKQALVIDSLLLLTKQQLENSVLVTENQALAIDPGLPQLGRVTVSSIAASLEPQQRVQFEKLLHARNAPYAVVASQVKATPPEEIYVKFPKSPRRGHFVLLTPDTPLVRQLEIDVDSLRDKFDRSMPSSHVRLNFDRFTQQFKQFTTEKGNVVVVGTHPMRVKGSEGSFSFEFETRKEDEVPKPDDIIHIVRPRLPRSDFFFEHRPPFDVELFMDDSLVPFGEKVDSIIQAIRRGQVKSYGPKLDSLMRRMEQLSDSTRIRRRNQERVKLEKERQ